MDIDLIKQQEIISDINGLFTISLASPYHEDIGGGLVKFTTNGNHNIVVGDRITFYNEMNDDNVITDYNDYNPDGELQYKVLSITSNTFTVSADYDASYDMTNAKVKTVKVYSNDILTPDDISNQDFPIVIVGVDNTYTAKSASNEYLPQETEFPFLVMDSIESYTGGVNTKLNSCREYVSNKFVFIMDYLELEIQNNIVYRYEGEFGTEVSVKKCVLIK